MKKQIYFYVVLLFLVILVITSYFNYSYKQNKLTGFPLDDTWIFLGYAKTLANTGHFSIDPNTPPSAGITAPLYLLIISFAFLLGLKSEFLFILILNIILLYLSSIFLYRIIFKLSDDFLLSSLLTIIFLIEPMTVSISNSGMETMLFVFFELFIIDAILEDVPYLVFLLIGIGFWVRPEIIFLLPFYILFYRKKIKIKNIMFFIIPFFLYFLFLKIFTGEFIAQTGKAKSVFFSYIDKLDFVKESAVYFFNIGFPLILILSFISIFFIRKKSKIFKLLFFYILFFYMFYLFYLPILYNFGRYLFPIVPLIFVLSSFSINKIPKKLGYFKIIIFIIIFLFAINNFNKGKINYAYKVHQFIVRHIIMANWINNNTPKNAIIATHDIGAIGYLTQRHIVDLVGLANKDVIGLSTQPDKLKSFLFNKKVNYIAVLNSWFRVINSPLLFETPKNSKMKFQIFKLTGGTQIFRVDIFYKKYYKKEKPNNKKR